MCPPPAAAFMRTPAAGARTPMDDHELPPGPLLHMVRQCYMDLLREEVRLEDCAPEQARAAALAALARCRNVLCVVTRRLVANPEHI